MYIKGIISVSPDSCILPLKSLVPLRCLFLWLVVIFWYLTIYFLSPSAKTLYSGSSLPSLEHSLRAEWLYLQLKFSLSLLNKIWFSNFRLCIFSVDTSLYKYLKLFLKNYFLTLDLSINSQACNLFSHLSASMNNHVESEEEGTTMITSGFW